MTWLSGDHDWTSPPDADTPCQRSLFDSANDAYGFWRDDQDQPVRRETVPCTCGSCPAEPVVHGGLVETAEALYRYGMRENGNPL